MKHCWVVGLISLFMISPLISQTQMADVTGDGVDDEIKIGEQSVVVIDGVSGKRFIVISGTTELEEVNVEDYYSGTPGKDIAVAYYAGATFFTVIYGFKNNQFVAVSETLPGKVTKIEGEEILFGEHSWVSELGGRVSIPCPIVEEKGVLKPLRIKKETRKTIVIDAGKTKEIDIEVSKNTLLVVYGEIEDKNVIISLKDGNDSTLATQKIDPENPFYFISDKVEKDETCTLIIDNSYSIMTPKTVFYIIVHYDFP